MTAQRGNAAVKVVCKNLKPKIVFIIFLGGNTGIEISFYVLLWSVGAGVAVAEDIGIERKEFFY